MDHAIGTKVLKRILAYLDEGGTAMAPAPWHNDVATYHCPRQLASEMDVLFRHHPLLMGLSCDWPQPGDWRTDDHAGVPILVVRGRDGLLRAFLNVCRHRGAKVAGGCGNAGLFTCPYHAWTYNLDGSLRGIPDERAFDGVRAERPGLVQLPLCERYGLVWVLPTPAADGGGALDIEPWLGGLGPELASYAAGTYHFYDRRLVPETMNWKILVDTFHESYHVGFLHRDSLGSILVPNVSDFEAFGANHRVVFPRRKVERLRTMPEAEWDLMWNSATVYCLFPNTLLVAQGDHLEMHRVFPAEGRPDRAIMETSFYIPRPVASAEEERHWQANLDLLMKVVVGEDFPAGRSMQIGFASGAQTHTVLGRNEPAMIHYHQSIRRALALPV
jgi:phenylpropionate dioxygenase-like ring-hydroxylating dioxygenase large terminal subunit